MRQRVWMAGLLLVFAGGLLVWRGDSAEPKGGEPPKGEHGKVAVVEADGWRRTSACSSCRVPGTSASTSPDWERSHRSTRLVQGLDDFAVRLRHRIWILVQVRYQYLPAAAQQLEILNHGQHARHEGNHE